MTNAKPGYGITFTVAGNAIAELKDATFPDPATNMLDVTNHGSTNGNKEFIPGLIDPGKVTLKGNFYSGDTNGQVVMMNARKNRTLLACVVTCSLEGTAATFNGYVTKFTPAAPVDKEVSFTAEIHLTGEPIYGITASSNLTALTISVGTLVPAFSAAQYSYIDSLTNGTASITVTPTNAAAASITVNGVAVTSGSASGAIATAIGTTLVTIISTDTGKAPVVYVLSLGRAS